ncbi:putative transcriptional regulator of viral defense system [Arcanobacterium pluranimalium]|nr:putative transcriptional regulator of viral defense system [Arcanobacterium pluranimalium]
MSKMDAVYEAVDDFGLISSAEAAKLGVSNVELVQYAHMGKLVRVARGIYRMPVWPFQPQAPYAIAVKAAGENAFLYGESVIALLGLAPTNPTKMWIASTRRIRRNLGSGTVLIRTNEVNPCWIEGIPCQSVVEAIVAAAPTMGVSRAFDAAREALAQGILTNEEMKVISGKLTQ